MEVTKTDNKGYIWFKVQFTKNGKKKKGWMREDVILPQEVRKISFMSKVNIKYQKSNNKFGKKTLYPCNNWFVLGMGKKYPKVCRKIDGRWAVAVGPEILEKNYDKKGKVLEEDFYSFSKCIEVHLIHKNNNSKYVMECQVVDLKAHTYTDYGYKNKKTGKNKDNIKKARVIPKDLQNGLIQTGIRYPNATNGWRISPINNMDGSIIEFCGHELGNGFEEVLKNYKLDYIKTNYTSATRGKMFEEVKK